jgi:hypothetical protein
LIQGFAQTEPDILDRGRENPINIPEARIPTIRPVNRSPAYDSKRDRV